MKNRARVLAEVLRSSTPPDDDQLAERLGIEPRQAVNHICRRLEAEGLLRRRVGSGGKIVNIALAPGPSVRCDVAAATPGLDPSPTAAPADLAGDSQEQRAAESVMLAELSLVVGVALQPRPFRHPSGARVELDGASEDLTVLAECWAHQGPAKVAQKNKLVNDAMKLHWIARTMPHHQARRLILCVSDETAVRHLRGRSWQGQAIADLGVKIVVVELPKDVAEAVAAAQKRQYR